MMVIVAVPAYRGSLRRGGRWVLRVRARAVTAVGGPVPVDRLRRPPEFAWPFWPLRSKFLSGAAAAGGIALINSLANLSGFAGPYAIGLLNDASGNFRSGFLLLVSVGAAGRYGSCVTIATRGSPEGRKMSGNALRGVDN